MRIFKFERLFLPVTPDHATTIIRGYGQKVTALMVASIYTTKTVMVGYADGVIRIFAAEYDRFLYFSERK